MYLLMMLWLGSAWFRLNGFTEKKKEKFRFSPSLSPHISFSGLFRWESMDMCAILPTWFNSNDSKPKFKLLIHATLTISESIWVWMHKRECKIECKLTTPNSFEQSFKCYARFSFHFSLSLSLCNIERCKLRLLCACVQWSLPNYY